MKHLHLVLLILFCFCTDLSFSFTYTKDGTEYKCTKLNNDEVAIRIISLSTSHVIVPDQVIEEKEYGPNGEQKYNSFKVTIFDGWEYDNKFQPSLKSIILPASIKEIGWMAFNNCSSLTNVYIPNVETIEMGAFYNCSSLSLVSGPNVKLIGSQAFRSCSSLSSISFPNVKIIEANAFIDCNSLTSAFLPKVQEINTAAFSGCTSLTNIRLPLVEILGNGVFENCTSLTNIDLQNAKELKGSTFRNCRSLMSVVIPNLETLTSNVFKSCTALTNISLAKVKEIGEFNFDGCNSIRSITINSPEPPTINSRIDIFDTSVYKKAKLIVPEEAIETYRNTYPWSRFYVTSAMENFLYSDFYELRNRRDVGVKGVTADGNTELLISQKGFNADFPVDDFKVVTKVNGEVVTDSRLIGEISPLTQIDDDEIGFPYGEVEIGFLYTAPDDYAGPEDSKSYTLEIEFTSPDEQKKLYATIEIWRPGVLLLHGLNSDSSCWNDAYNYLVNIGSYTPAQLLNYSYKESNSVTFDDNTYKYKVVDKALKRLHAMLRANGIVSSCYDLVGHSMGGILSRKYAQEVESRVVNRILTFNTPHSGSPLGNLANTIREGISNYGGVLLNALKWWAEAKYPAVLDLATNSSAIKLLNSPEAMENAEGIPVHAACTMFDNTTAKEFEKNQTPITEQPQTMIPIWLACMEETSTDYSNPDFHLSTMDELNIILGDNRHDGVVPLTSQQGGLTIQNGSSLLTDECDEETLGFGSNAHHCNMTHWEENHQRLIALLRASKDDSRFATAFKPVSLSSAPAKNRAPRKAVDAKPESFIRMTAERTDSISRLVDIHLEASEDVVRMGAFCVIDDDRVIMSDFTDNFTFSIPSDYAGKLEIAALGYTSYGAWVVDGAELDFEDEVSPYYILFDSGYPLTISAGETIEPQVTAYWENDQRAIVSAELSLVDCNGEAEVTGSMLTGLREGKCQLVANYRNMTDTIPVTVINAISSVEDLVTNDESDMKLFRRNNQIVVKMMDDYTGTVDYEVFDLEGRLVKRSMTAGTFASGEEAAFGLPERNGSLLVVRVRREDGRSIGMKTFN